MKNIEVGGTPAIFNKIKINNNFIEFVFIISFSEFKYTKSLLLKLIKIKKKFVKEIK